MQTKWDPTLGIQDWGGFLANWELGISKREMQTKWDFKLGNSGQHKLGTWEKCKQNGEIRTLKGAADKLGT